MLTLNREALYNRLMQDEKLVKMLLAEFLKDLPLQIRLLSDKISAKDLNDVARQAHKIKGTAGNVGAEILQHLMMAMEKAVEESDYIKMDELLLEIENQFSAIKQEVEEVLK